MMGNKDMKRKRVNRERRILKTHMLDTKDKGYEWESK
jgi:hypothetical protein